MASRLGSVDPSNYPNEQFELYSIPAFDVGKPETVKGSDIRSSKQVVQTGDMLLSRIVPHIRRAWVVDKGSGRRKIASGEWIVFRGEQVEPRYLRHVVVGDSFHAQFMRTVSGVGGSLLRARAAFVAKIRVPMPSLTEQRRIAEILDKADALRAKRRAAIAQLDALTQSTFLDMFGDPATNPKGWPMVALGRVADVQGGLQLSRKRDTLPREVPYLRVANVHRGALDLSEIKMLRASEAEIRRTRLEKNDLLIVEGHGNPSEIGRGALWDGSIAECVHQNHLIRVRIDAQIVSPLFACVYLNSQGGRRHLLRAGKTTSGLNTISVSDVRAAPIALAPISLQRRFVRQIGEVDAMRTTQQASLETLDALSVSLQYRVFRGECRDALEQPQAG